MPWKNELPIEQKQRFINLAQSGRFTVSELSEEFRACVASLHRE
jgi:hypothetical protein